MGNAPRQSPTPAHPALRPASASSAIEQVEGRVESITDAGVRVNGLWYDWPHGWSGRRPPVGQVVRVCYRTKRIVSTISAPVSGAPGAGSSPKPAAGAPNSGAWSRERKTVTGVIAACNDRGVRIGETWYNFSRFTPLPEEMRMQLAKGTHVRLEIDNHRWIAGATIGAETGGGAGSAGGRTSERQPDGEAEQGWDDSYL